MHKINRKFNSACSRVAFWTNLTHAIAGLDTLLKAQAAHTPDDVKDIKAIHRLLYNCYKTAKSRTILHKLKIDTLRKEFIS